MTFSFGVHVRVTRCETTHDNPVLHFPPMTRNMFKSKIHRLRVTGADVGYEGSVTLDPLATFSQMSDAEARAHVPTVVFVDEHNRVRERRPEVPNKRAAG